MLNYQRVPFTTFFCCHGMLRQGVLAAGALSPIFGQGLGSALAGFIVGPDAQGTETLLAGQAGRPGKNVEKCCPPSDVNVGLESP